MQESEEVGVSWKEINKTPLFGKEPSLTALPSGTLVMSAQKGYFGPGSKAKESINIARSTDGGRTWELYDLPGADYPRNMIVERDGSLLFVRAVKSDWSDTGDGSTRGREMTGYGIGITCSISPPRPFWVTKYDCRLNK